MFRFTIRELLLLTMVVGLGAAWGLRERQLRSALEAQTKDGVLWKHRCEGMNQAIGMLGGKSEWDENSVSVDLGGGVIMVGIPD